MVQTCCSLLGDTLCPCFSRSNSLYSLDLVFLFASPWRGFSLHSTSGVASKACFMEDGTANRTFLNSKSKAKLDSRHCSTSPRHSEICFRDICCKWTSHLADGPETYRTVPPLLTTQYLHPSMELLWMEEILHQLESIGNYEPQQIMGI